MRGLSGAVASAGRFRVCEMRDACSPGPGFKAPERAPLLRLPSRHKSEGGHGYGTVARPAERISTNSSSASTGGIIPSTPSGLCSKWPPPPTVQPTPSYIQVRGSAPHLVGRCDNQIVKVRAPAIYGPGALGKFGTLARLMYRTGWLPVTRVVSCRSVVHCDIIAAVISEMAARPAGGGARVRRGSWAV